MHNGNSQLQEIARRPSVLLQLNVHVGCETSNYNSSVFEREEERNGNKEGEVWKFERNQLNYHMHFSCCIPFY